MPFTYYLSGKLFFRFFRNRVWHALAEHIPVSAISAHIHTSETADCRAILLTAAHVSKTGLFP